MYDIGGQRESFPPFVGSEFNGYAVCGVGAERVEGEQDVALVLCIDTEDGMAHGCSCCPDHIAYHPYRFIA